MSVTTISEAEARRYAEDKVRSELGMFLRVGEGWLNEEEERYEFELLIRSPKLVENREGEVTDVRYFEELDLGKVTVDGSTGEVSRPNIRTIKSKIREQRKEVEIAVRKALVSAAGRQFSHLPFPENQFAPMEDILSYVLVHGSIEMNQIRLMDQDRGNDRYSEYVSELIELDLLKRDEDVISSGNVLIGLEDESESYQDTVNRAIGRYFEHNIGDFNMINRTLGPYLVIAGRYYRQAILQEDMPLISADDLRQAIISEYTGKEKHQKLMKMYRYLVHLEEVGILKPIKKGRETYWVGDDDIEESLREHRELLGPVQALFPENQQRALD